MTILVILLAHNLRSLTTVTFELLEYFLSYKKEIELLEGKQASFFTSKGEFLL